MAQLGKDYRQADLPPRQRAMLDYAVQLTLEPWTVDEDDIETLRQAGLDDSEILDTAQVAAYYAFVNRLASGLGVELEGYWDGDESTASSGD